MENHMENDLLPYSNPKWPKLSPKNESVTNIDAKVFAQRTKVTKYSVLLQKVSGELT